MEEEQFEELRKHLDTPYVEFNQPKFCSKCGLELNKIMGYCCPNSDCPTRMGPIIC